MKIIDSEDEIWIFVAIGFVILMFLYQIFLVWAWDATCTGPSNWYREMWPEACECPRGYAC